MAKEIQISVDGGSTYLTLPGNTGELSREQASLDDTIFGSTFSSNQPGITSWTVSANGFYKGIPGYVATIQSSGTSTSTTGEAFSNTSGQTYQIDDATKRVWDPENTVTIKDNGSVVSASNIKSLDYLFGKVTFVSGYSVTGPVTADLNYLPMSQFGKSQTFTLTQTAETEDVTTLAEAQTNGGFAVMDYSLQTAELSTEGFWSVNNDIHDLITNRNLLVLELNPDGNGDSVVRGFFKVASQSQSADAGATESESVSYTLFVPENNDSPNPVRPISWEHTTGTELSTVLQNTIDAWFNRNKVDVRYYPIDPSGESFTGKAVITDISLEGGIGNMNNFTVELAGSGKLTHNSP